MIPLTENTSAAFAKIRSAPEKEFSETFRVDLGKVVAALDHNKLHPQGD
jgi:hypothetical protein